MFQTMSFEEFEKSAAQKLKIPVYKQIPGDMITLISIFQALVKKGEKACLLEIANQDAENGPYSFIGFNPYLSFESKDDTITISQNGSKSYLKGDPIAFLNKLMIENKAVELSHIPPFSGGAVGYFSYDSIRLFEKIPGRHAHMRTFPDLFFNFYQNGIVFDQRSKIITFFYIISPTRQLEKDYTQSLQELNRMIERIASSKQSFVIKPQLKLDLATVDIDDITFHSMVLKAKDYIRNGDIFQVVLSRTFRKESSVDPFDVFRSLRLVNPSAYLFYLQEPDYQVAGASPERLVECRQGILKTNPLAGTYPKPPKEREKQMEEDLLNNPKECAEHMMLVDLGRNDLGSIAEIGSVKVKQLKSIVRLAHVIHISSEVVAKIRPPYLGLDAIRATLPAGTLSGAPKIRAMEIIDELEQSARDLYGGAICYLGNQGNIDSCIAIRMAVFKDRTIEVRTGAGIVYDSDPEKEADETRHKAKGVLAAIELAEMGLL